MAEVSERLRREHNTPLPHVLDKEVNAEEEGWQIVDSGLIHSSVDKTNRVMMVPLGEDDCDAGARLHEMAHAKWSPELTPELRKEIAAYGVNMDTVQACEDLRVHYQLHKNAKELVPILADLKNDAMDTALATSYAKMSKNSKRGLISLGQLMVSALLTGRWDSVFKAAREHANSRDFNMAHHAASIAGSELASDSARFSRTLAVAKKVERILGEYWEDKAAKQKMKEKGEEEGEEDAPSMDEVIDAVEKMEAGLGGGKYDPVEADTAEWGKMTIETPPRSVTLMGKIGRRRRCMEEGEIPSRMHRLTVDGAIFGTKKRQYGGTVLIDKSGSMSMRPQDVKAIIEAAPGATVAMYAGNDRDGVLRILASKGSMVDPYYGHSDRWSRFSERDDEDDEDDEDGDYESNDQYTFPFGGNIIDGPALDWLAEGDHPRIWVSDGQVTTIGDNGSSACSMYAVKVCTEKRILRIDNVDAAVRYLKAKARLSSHDTGYSGHRR